MSRLLRGIGLFVSMRLTALFSGTTRVSSVGIAMSELLSGQLSGEGERSRHKINARKNFARSRML